MRLLKALVIGALSLAAFLQFAAAAAGSSIGSNTTNFTGVASRTLTLDPGGLSITCDITFTFTISRTPVTVAWLPAVITDYGTASARAACPSGVTLIFLNAPWRYNATMSGGPGNVTASTSFNIKNMQFEVGLGSFFRCLYAGDVPGTINALGSIFSISTSVPYVNGGIACPVPMRMAGTASLNPNLRLTLV